MVEERWARREGGEEKFVEQAISFDRREGNTRPINLFHAFLPTPGFCRVGDGCRVVIINRREREIRENSMRISRR